MESRRTLNRIHPISGGEFGLHRKIGNATEHAWDIGRYPYVDRLVFAYSD